MSSSTASAQNPWSGRLQEKVSPASSSNVSHKGKEKLHDFGMPELSASHYDVDGDLSGSEQSLDDEFGIPALKTPRVRKYKWQGRILGLI